MKVLALLLLFITSATFAHGQKVEFAGQLNTGLAKFIGESAGKTTTILYSKNPAGTNSYTNSPYGNIWTPSYGASVQLQRVTQKNLLLGVQAGVESLRHRINIDGVYVTESTWSSAVSEYKEASGKTILRNDLLNLHPYLGYRVSAGAVEVDFSFGPEAGFVLQSGERGEATAQDGSGYTTDRERFDSHTVDIRSRVGVTTYYNQFGISASYAHGFINYLGGYDGANPKLNATAVRLGLLYRL